MLGLLTDDHCSCMQRQNANVSSTGREARSVHRALPGHWRFHINLHVAFVSKAEKLSNCASLEWLPTSMRDLLRSENSEEMILETSLPIVSAACMKLTPSTPRASCCSCAVLSSILMWIMMLLGRLLHSQHMHG